MDTKNRWLTSLAASVLIGALAVPAFAQSDTETIHGAGAPASVAAPEHAGTDKVTSDDASDVEEVNEETDELVAFLAERGFEVAVETDDAGYRHIAFTDSDESNDALWTAVDDFFAERYGDDAIFDGEFVDGELLDDLSEEDIAEINTEQDELAEFLDSKGITYERIDEGDISWVEWDYDDEAANAAVEEFYEEQYGDDSIFDGEFVDGELLDDLSEEDIAEINTEQDELAEFLDSKGITYERIDEGDISWVEWDYDDEAANAAVEEFYAPSPEEVAEIQAEIDEWIAELDEAGINYELVTDDYGIAFPEIAEADLDELEELDGLFFDICEEDPGDDTPDEGGVHDDGAEEDGSSGEFADEGRSDDAEGAEAGDV